jgi:hypothetical protein
VSENRSWFADLLQPDLELSLERISSLQRDLEARVRQFELESNYNVRRVPLDSTGFDIALPTNFGSSDIYFLPELLSNLPDTISDISGNTLNSSVAIEPLISTSSQGTQDDSIYNGSPEVTRENGTTIGPILDSTRSGIDSTIGNSGRQRQSDSISPIGQLSSDTTLQGQGRYEDASRCSCSVDLAHIVDAINGLTMALLQKEVSSTPIVIQNPDGSQSIVDNDSGSDLEFIYSQRGRQAIESRLIEIGLSGFEDKLPDTFDKAIEEQYLFINGVG